MPDVSNLSDDQKRQLEDEQRRRAFRSGPHYVRWQRLERIQQARFKRSVDDNKVFFDFLRMVLTTGLLIGLITFLFKSSPPDVNGGSSFPFVVVPLCFLTIIAGTATWIAMRRFLALVATSVAIHQMWPFKVRRRADAWIYSAMWAVQIFFFVSIVGLGWLVAEQTSSRAKSTDIPTINKPPQGATSP